MTNAQLKKKLTVSRTDDSCNKEREVQDVGDEDIMYEPLLDDIELIRCEDVTVNE